MQYFKLWVNVASLRHASFFMQSVPGINSFERHQRRVMQFIGHPLIVINSSFIALKSKKNKGYTSKAFYNEFSK